MKKLHTLSIIIGTLLISLTLGVLPSFSAVSAGAPLERKIIVFKDGAGEEEKDNILVKAGALRLKHLKSAESSVVFVDKEAERKLKQHWAIARVEDDIEVWALEEDDEHVNTNRQRSLKASATQPAEVLPWGVDRIDAELIWGTTTADVVKVAVIDTGIDFSHPDLTANIKGNYNAIDPTKSGNDDNGHGTHVAGIIAAVDNTIGVIGVAPKADLYAVKVLNRSGSGYVSDVIEGIDWAVTHGMSVANLSLGASIDIQSLHDAVIRAKNAGVVVVAAAGNSYGGAVSYPAAYTEAIAVSATDFNDNLASFSSVGSEVDLAAPGASIYSTYRRGAYKTLSGTSMASPHVAGVAALLLSRPEKCDADFDGMCSPAEVQTRLESTARDLGALGKDNSYGSGLVDAYAALTW